MSYMIRIKSNCKFLKNTNMSIQHMYIRAYGPAVSGRDRGIPELQTGADTLIRPAHWQGGGDLLYNNS
jgi:hypothetical protein